METITNLIWSILPILLFGLGIYFTIHLKFIQIFKWRILGKELFRKDEETGVSALSSMVLSIGTRVGVGNIAGITTAIMFGGPGAIFWLWVTAFLGMATAIIEGVLAQLYKVRDNNGVFMGGPAYYIRDGLKNYRLSWFYAIIAIFAFIFLCMTQVNEMTNTINNVVNINQEFISIYIIGLICVFLIGIVIIGGVRKIVHFSDVVVPVMGAGYLLLCLIGIIMNIELLPSALNLIMTDAFTAQAVAGGAIGLVIIWGVKRSSFSTEAGMSSAPHSAAAADQKHPFSQATMQMMGVLIVTIIGTFSGLIIILTESYTSASLENGGMYFAQVAFYELFGFIGVVLLSIAVFLFTFTTIVGYYYYWEVNLKYVFKKRRTKVIIAFQVLFLILLYVGSVGQTATMWILADFAFGTLALINLYVITRLLPKVIKLQRDYFKKAKNNFDDISFKEEDIDINNTEVWK